MKLAEKDITRFWSKVDVLGEAECWNWTASLVGGKGGGYGKFWLNGKMLRSHRISWVLYNGQIAESLSVCHHCDNPKCVNPKHLFVGTHADNMKDKRMKLRQARGEMNGASKLEESDIAEIFLSNKPSRALGKRYGVDKITILRIKRRETWTYITDAL